MKHSTFITKLFTLFMAVFLTACTVGYEPKQGQLVPINDVAVHTSWSAEAGYSQEWHPEPGVGIGFVRPEHRGVHPEQRPQTAQFTVAEGEPFSTYLILAVAEPQTVLVSAIVNYEQVPFTLDGSTELLHQFEVEPGGDLEIPISIDLPKNGLHEVMVVAFVDPYYDFVDERSRAKTRLDFVGYRAQVIAGGDSTPVIDHLPPSVLAGSAVPYDIQLGFNVNFAANTPEHPAHDQLYASTGHTPGAPFSARLWASNINGTQPAQYAVMLFQDYHQRPINNEHLIIAELDPQEELIYPFTTTLPTTPGVSQLELVLIFDPYRSILYDDVLAPFVFNSARIAVNTGS